MFNDILFFTLLTGSYILLLLLLGRGSISAPTVRAVQTALDSMEEAFLVLDAERLFMRANNAFFQIFPQAVGIKKGQAVEILADWPQELRDLSDLAALTAKREFSMGNDSSVRYYKACISPITNSKWQIKGWVVLIQDISSMMAERNELESMAYIDSLTGICNRRHFIEGAELEFNKAMRNERPCAIILFDLDHFKKVNDVYGHLAGDEVLKAVAANVRKALRPYDRLARFGGEEFIVLAELDEREAMLLAGRIKDEIGLTPYLVNGVEIRCTASFGVAMRASAAESLKTVIHNADTALYKAKNKGRNRVELYSDNELAAQIRQAMEEGYKGFQLYYQPIFTSRTAVCVGAECLLRWESPQEEIIMPDIFMPVVEKQGLLAELEKWVLNTSCHQCKLWLELFENPSFYIHVNLSPNSLNSEQLYNEVQEAININGLLPANIVLEFREILETLEFEDKNVSLHKLRQSQVRVALDNFSYESSPFLAFKRSSIDELRISRDSISDIEEDSTARNLLTGLIHMVKSLNQQVGAIGVETDWQKQFLEQQGVDTLQGYLLGEPMTPQKFAETYLAYAKSRLSKVV